LKVLIFRKLHELILTIPISKLKRLQKKIRKRLNSISLKNKTSIST
jgi:hypothetical protein